MMNKTDQILKEVSDKIGLRDPMTIEELAKAYLRVRESNIKFMNETNEIRKNAEELGRQQGYAEITDFEYIKRETLLKMSVKELTEYLYEG